MHPITAAILLALQCFHVLFLALHDWIPLGTLNDLKAVRATYPLRKRIVGTLISLIPFVIGLAASGADQTCGLAYIPSPTEPSNFNRSRREISEGVLMETIPGQRLPEP